MSSKRRTGVSDRFDYGDAGSTAARWTITTGVVLAAAVSALAGVALWLFRSRAGFALLLVAGLASAGCSSTAPTPDQDHGVSNASYRKAVVRAAANVAQVESKLVELSAFDLTPTATHSEPLHAPDWWRGEILLVRETRNLLEDTLKGADK